MKLGVLALLVATLALAACATQPSAQMLDAKVQRNVKGCIAKGWMHDGIVSIGRIDAPWDRHGHHHFHGVYPIPGPPDLPRIEQKCL